MRGIARVSSGAGRTAIIVSFLVGAAAAPGVAQTAPARTVADQRQSRYEISQMERLLEGAVEHGLTNVRERMQAAMKAEGFVNENAENAHVRGFRLDGFGVFFDIEVPSLQGSLLWSLRTLDQNDLGLASALQALKKHVDTAGDVDLKQALKRIELQMPMLPAAMSGPAVPASTGARLLTGAPATAPDKPALDPAADPILRDPLEAYRAEIQRQIQEAMVNYSSALALGPDEWLTIGARGHYERPLIAPADTDQRTVIIKIKGSDLRAMQAGQITREEAIKRMEVRVF